VSTIEPTRRQLRALAHPLRLRILGELRVTGPLTGKRLCEILDDTPGNVSYHLGVLAEFGFIEEVPELATDRRERWWRSAHDSTRLTGPDSAPARHNVIDAYAATLHRAIDAGTTAMSADVFAHLTQQQLDEAGRELEAVLTKWADAGRRDTEGAVAVQLIAHALRRP
jgi:DNA-binding transcriptional ArsR family regulator